MQGYDDLIILSRIQSQYPDLPVTKDKHVPITGTRKPLILTPTHALSFAGIVIGIVIGLVYVGIIVYFLLEAQEREQYVIAFSGIAGALGIYLISKLSIFVILSIVGILATAAGVNHFQDYYPVPGLTLILVALASALCLAVHQYRIYHRKERIWTRITGDNTAFGRTGNALIAQINKHDHKDIAYKMQAEENTHHTISRLSNKARFYQFYGLSNPYVEDNYIDTALLAGKNLVLIRSIMVNNDRIELQHGNEKEESSKLNVADLNWAQNVIEYYSRAFPHLKISVFFIVYPSGKPDKDGKRVTIGESKGKVRLIMGTQAHEVERVLFSSRLPFFRTRRSDIIKLTSMRKGAYRSASSQRDEAYFSRRF